MKYLTILALTLTACGGGAPPPVDYNTWTDHPTYVDQRACTQQLTGCDVIVLGDSRVKWGDWEPRCNFGIDSDTTFGVLNRIDDVLAEQPSTVILQMGRNDLHAAGRSVAETYSNYMAVVVELRTAGIEVVVTSTIPDSTPSLQIDQLNELLEGPFYLDLYPALAPDGVLVYTDDGVHPNAEGYERWYGLLLELL